MSYRHNLMGIVNVLYHAFYLKAIVSLIDRAGKSFEFHQYKLF